mgnify:CR=1 FL=1
MITAQDIQALLPVLSMHTVSGIQLLPVFNILLFRQQLQMEDYFRNVQRFNFDNRQIRDRGWNEETVMAFELTESENALLDGFYDSFESLRKDRDLYQDRLESHRRLAAEKMSEGWNIPNWLKMFQH